MMVVWQGVDRARKTIANIYYSEGSTSSKEVYRGIIFNIETRQPISKTKCYSNLSGCLKELDSYTELLSLLNKDIKE